MDQMDQMISEIETTLTPREFAIFVASITVIVGAPRVAFALLRKRRNKKQPIMSYSEFLNSGDDMTRFYTHQAVN